MRDNNDDKNIITTIVIIYIIEVIKTLYQKNRTRVKKTHDGAECSEK